MKENEVKVTEKNIEKEVVTNEVEVKELKTKNKLFLERVMFTGNDGKEYYSYLLKGKVRDRDVKVDFAPKDKGGYEVLDIVFEVGAVELVIAEETMTNQDGKKTKYTTYKAVAYDEDNFPYECGVKPSQDSDKALLKMLLNSLGGVR